MSKDPIQIATHPPTRPPQTIELEIIDNGRSGLSRDAAAGPGPVPGHGIVGMRERAAVFGGEVSAGPGPAGGWRVHTVLHLSPATDARGADAPAGAPAVPAGLERA